MSTIGSAVITAKIDVQVKLGLDPTLMDGALSPRDDCLLHPLDSLSSRQLAKSTYRGRGDIKPCAWCPRKNPWTWKHSIATSP